MFRLITSAALATALAAGASVSAETKSRKADPDEVTCKYMQVVDSRIPQKVCMTNFEWEDRARAQEEARRSSANGNSSCGGPEGDFGPC